MNQNPFELEVVSVRLVKDAPILSEKAVKTPMAAVSLLGELLCDMDREVVCVVNLKADGRPINCHFASMGALRHAVAEPRELFKAAILSNAVSMVLLHNHPSESLQPSREDIRITDCILRLGELISIPLVDHIIVGAWNNKEYFSFKEKGLIHNTAQVYATDYRDLSFHSPLHVAEGGKVR